MIKKDRMLAEEKVRIVEEYLSGKQGRTAIIKKYGIGLTTLRGWIRLYETRGASGLMKSSRNRKYAPEVKLSAVREYLAGKGSLSEICRKYDISDGHMLRQWIKLYNSHKDYKQPNSGGAIYMAKGRDTTLDERIEIVSYCIANNKDYSKTIEQFGVSYQQIYGWVKKYGRNGAAGLTDRRGKRKDVEAMSEIEKLRAQLKLKEAENMRLQMENDLLKKLEEIEGGRGQN